MHDQEFIGKLAQINQQLNKENQAYFGKIQQYLLLSFFVYDEKSLQQQLLGMAADLLEAQQQGEDAESFFGKDPRGMVDEILRNTKPTSWLNKWQFMAGTFGIVALFLVFVAAFTEGPMLLSPVKFILVGLLIAGFFYLFFLVVKQLTFQKRVWPVALAMMGMFALCFGGILAIFILMPPVLGIPLPYPLDMIMIASIFGGAVMFIFYKKMRDQYALLPTIAGIGAWGIYFRYMEHRQLVISDETSVVIAVVLSLLILFWYSSMIYRMLPSKSRK